MGIGASAGGLEAFTELLRSLPSDAPLAYVLVQHLDPTHRSLLSELLAKTTALPVHEIADHTRVEANRVYVIPPNCDLSIKRGILKLTPREKSGGPTRSIDHFLQSLASDQGKNAVGVILSGAGSDGAQGLKAIKEAGGVTFAQDDGSSKYDSMPRSAVATGCVDFVLPPPKIAEELARLLETSNLQKRRAAANARQRRGTVTAKPVRLPEANGKVIAWPKAPEDVNLRKIFLLLRTRTGTDFSLYRINTIRRRVTRRMGLNKIKGLDAYARYLREHPTEIDALYQDLLINVTSFFRNPSVFERLKKKVFPRLVKNAASGEALRVWVTGCSTGQEPYSIAMAYAEFAELNENALPIQIFATDLNASILEQARAGRYTAAQVSGVGAARLRRFFTEENGAYRVSKPIRDMVIFAQQNLIIDPPFTRVDLISCRNVLIYLEPALQQKIIPAFHYALKPNGILLLGTSESVGSFHQLFDSLERGQKIYVKKPAASLLRFERPPVVPTTKAVRVPPGTSAAREFNVADAFKEADRITLAKYGPVSVLVAEDGEILQFRGAADRYLDLPSGRASFQLLKMAREGLALPLENAFQRAKKENRVVREKDIRFDRRRGVVNIEIVPLKNLKARCFLVLFERATPKPPPAEPASERGGRGTAAAGRALSLLKRDYAEAREHLANLQEAHDTSVEELQASNEEVQSTNEELQSLNEELETSNEELESANEELTTLNEELATRNAELRESEQRLREQAQMLDLAPVLARSPKDRIIFWNRGAEKLYGFSKEEAMGQTTHRFLNAQYSEPLEKIEKDLYRRGHWSGEILHRRKDGQVICVASQWVVHHDSNHKVRAILEVNNDITARRHAEEALRQSEAFNRSILETSPDCILVLDLAGRITFVNAAGQEALGLDLKKLGKTYWPAVWEGESRVAAEKAYHAALAGETAHFRESWPVSKGKVKWWDVAVRPILSGDGRPEKLLVVARDVTVHRRNEMTLRDDARWAQFRADLAFAFIPSNTTEQIYEQAGEIIGRHFAAAFAGIWVTAGPDFKLCGRGGTYTGDELVAKFGDALARRITGQAEPFLIHDVGRDESLWDPAWLQKEGVQSIIGHPVVIEDERCGAIAVFSKLALDSRAVQELSLATIGMGQAISRKVAEDIRARLTHEAFEARAEVELLNEVGRKIAAELDPQKLAQAVADAATQLVKAEAGAFVYSLRDEKDQMFHQAVAGARPELFAGFSERVRGLPEPVLTGQGITSFDKFAPQLRSPDPGHNGHLPLRSFLAIPVTLRSGNVVGGLFFGHTRDNAFAGREERVALNLAGQAAIAMENARLVDHLERKVSERTARLQETISELQAFSYTVSHDLRAPLRAMQSYAQVLIEDCGPELTATARDYLKRIETAGVRLDRLIQDVLTYGRISRSQVVVQPLDLEKLLQALMQQYPMLRAPAADIRIQGPLPLILAEESSVTQCLSNLLGNAVKFVPPGRQPVVTIRAELRDPRVRIWIEDNGIGIAPQDRERIFKMFERVDTPHEYEGTGIGLAIVRKAAERMGGAVGVESQPGEGSRFWLEFNQVPS